MESVNFFGNYLQGVNNCLIFDMSNKPNDNDMKYLHQVTDKDGNATESIYSNTSKPRMSMTILKDIVKGQYKIWDRSNWEFEIV